jgi:hypothetical protein
MEGCFCNCIAVSANRGYVMEKFDLSADPCDYRLIRINNCLQALSCICNILAIFLSDIRNLARYDGDDSVQKLAVVLTYPARHRCIDRLADVFYHCVSGCMTAQVRRAV